MPGNVAAHSEPVEGVGDNNTLLGGGNMLLGDRDLWLRAKTRYWGSKHATGGQNTLLGAETRYWWVKTCCWGLKLVVEG